MMASLLTKILMTFSSLFHLVIVQMWLFNNLLELDFMDNSHLVQQLADLQEDSLIQLEDKFHSIKVNNIN